jgi:hypothetical protein
MKAVWDWIVKAAQDVYKAAWEVIGFFRDKNGKASFKRISGAAALIVGIDFLFRGGVVEGLILIVYAAAMGILAAVTGT